MPFSVRMVNAELDRFRAKAPARRYYSHAAKRLADLIDSIREKYPNDTVTVISYSRGTMVAMAATLMAKKAPDALFVMNSPFAMEHKTIDRFSYPFDEYISSAARQKTLANIVEKVTKQASHLSQAGYSRLPLESVPARKAGSPPGWQIMVLKSGTITGGPGFTVTPTTA